VIEELADVMIQLMEDGLGADAALSKVKYDKSLNPKTGKAWNFKYTERFSGNTTRVDKGLNALSEGEYLAIEDSYARTLKAYGLGNMISLDRAVNQKKFAGWMTQDLDPEEFKDRIDLVSTRVNNADPNVLANFKKYFPSLDNTDLISYFLAPAETLPKLKIKVTSAEIGAAANIQGLNVSGTRAQEFALGGTTFAEAQVAYSKIATELPTGAGLTNVFRESKIKYDQTTAEDEFIKGDALASQKRKRLGELQRGVFSGSAGARLGKQSPAGLI